MKYKSIQEYLDKTGKTEKQFADELGIAQSHVNMIKKGTRRPTPELALKIEQITGIPFKKLLLSDSAA